MEEDSITEAGRKPLTAAPAPVQLIRTVPVTTKLWVLTWFGAGLDLVRVLWKMQPSAAMLALSIPERCIVGNRGQLFDLRGAYRWRTAVLEIVPE